MNATKIEMVIVKSESGHENNIITFVASVSDKTFINILSQKKYGSIVFLLPEKQHEN